MWPYYVEFYCYFQILKPNLSLQEKLTIVSEDRRLENIRTFWTTNLGHYHMFIIRLVLFFFNLEILLNSLSLFVKVLVAVWLLQIPHIRFLQQTLTLNFLLLKFSKGQWKWVELYMLPKYWTITVIYVFGYQHFWFYWLLYFLYLYFQSARVVDVMTSWRNLYLW